jgi:hypothetical protein
VVEDPEAVVGADEPGQADDQRVGRGGIPLLQQGVPVGVDEVRQALPDKPGVQSGTAPSRVALALFKETQKKSASGRKRKAHAAAATETYQ